MKSFYAWIEKRGLELKDRVVISLAPRSHDRLNFARRELTTIELGEVHGLYMALDGLIRDNPKVFHADGSLAPQRGRTTIVIEHDLNKPLDFKLGPEDRIVSRTKEPAPAGKPTFWPEPSTGHEYIPER